MLTLVILPGLDGTTRLLSDFIDVIRPSFDSVVAVGYPDDRVLDYAELESTAREALPKAGRFVLLGESFSGPIALSIAARPPEGLAGLILSTTFARNPVVVLRPFAGLARFAPVRTVPLAVLSWFLLGPWATPSMRSALRAALQSVDASVLRARAAMALRVDVTQCLSRITVPILYLRATEDRLLLPRGGDMILQALPHSRLVCLRGPHLLLQTAPILVADAINAFIKESNLSAWIRSTI